MILTRIFPKSAPKIEECYLNSAARKIRRFEARFDDGWKAFDDG